MSKKWKHIGTNALEVCNPEMHTREHRNKLFKFGLELEKMKPVKPKKTYEKEKNDADAGL